MDNVEKSKMVDFLEGLLNIVKDEDKVEDNEKETEVETEEAEVETEETEETEEIEETEETEDKVEKKEEKEEEGKEEKKEEDIKLDMEKVQELIETSNKIGKENKVLKVAIGLGIDPETAAKRVDMFNPKLSVEEIIEAVNEMAPEKDTKDDNIVPPSRATGFGDDGLGGKVVKTKSKNLDLSDVSLSDLSDLSNFF